MTVFVAIRAKYDASYAIACDCLLSSKIEQEARIELPFSVIEAGASFTTYNLTRKAFFPHPKVMLLWAGSLLFAKVLARHLASHLDRLLFDSGSFNFQRLIAECLALDEALSCQFLLVRIIPSEGEGMRIRYHQFNCQDSEDDTFTFLGAGKGFDIATAGMWLGDDARNEGPDVSSLTAFAKAVRIVTSLISNENFTDTFKYSFVGGWYEIFVPTPDGFLQIPYSINTFLRNRDNWEMITRFSSHYNNGNLLVVRASFDLLAELSTDPDYRINGTEFHLFPVVELYMQDPSLRRVQLNLQDIFGKTSQFSLNVFIDGADSTVVINFVPGRDVLVFGSSNSEIRINIESLEEILRESLKVLGEMKQSQ